MLLMSVIPIRTGFELSAGPTEITGNGSIPNTRIYHYSKARPSAIRVSACNIISRDIDTV
jgi:hypothetical protein